MTSMRNHSAFPASRIALLAFAACYLGVGGYFALGAAGQGSAQLRCFIAVTWPLIFSRYSPAGTLCMLVMFAAVAAYVRRLHDGRSVLSGQLARLALNEARLGEQLRLCEEKGRRAARERDEALRRLAQTGDRAQALEQTTALPVAGDRNSFALAKRAFARLNHPDQAAGEPAERRIRAEVFKEYWRELQRIEDAARAARTEP